MRCFGMRLEKGPRTDTSPNCTENDHAGCRHMFALRGRFIGRQPEANAVLCPCACHAGCPIAGDEYVTTEKWVSLCTCPGAVEAKTWQGDYDLAAAERTTQVKEIVESIEIVGTKSRSDDRSELERSYEEHGITPDLYELEHGGWHLGGSEWSLASCGSPSRGHIRSVDLECDQRFSKGLRGLIGRSRTTL
jgi:hypothetical protein